MNVNTTIKLFNNSKQQTVSCTARSNTTKTKKVVWEHFIDMINTNVQLAIYCNRKLNTIAITVLIETTFLGNSCPRTR